MFSSLLKHPDLSLQNLEAWEEAKREIDKIPDHPNTVPPPPPQQPQDAVGGVVAGPSGGGRRDSTATVNGR